MSHDYSKELRKSEILLVSEAYKRDTLPETPAELRLIIESAYRRGFTQGAAECLEWFEKKYGVHNKMQKWIEQLLDWRYRRRNGKFELPPHTPT